MAKDHTKLLKAAQLMATGVEPELKTIPTEGRPRQAYMVGGLELSKAEMGQLVKKKTMEVKSQNVRMAAMDDMEFQTFCRGAVQDLLPGLLKVASKTDDYKFLLNLVKELADRGYGKSVQAVEISNPKRDIREGWNIIDVN